MQWNQGRHQGNSGACDAFWKQAMSMQKKHGWAAAYSRPELQWTKKIFRSGHWCFPKWRRYCYGRGGPEWSWRYVSWKNLSRVRRLLVVQYLESCCGNFEINSMANGVASATWLNSLFGGDRWTFTRQFQSCVRMHTCSLYPKGSGWMWGDNTGPLYLT